ncbi:MAG: glutamate--tRNA ligase [Alphaproteobacteria bacterium]|nr:glutamate--tRNA ligase [Alphaproteobacteria bacterium]MCD8526182.1 glutamate--tRNA ligase [Alphaproteobacteria bacterium]MCD8570078.1 glutamate--tRNA ligase [Alphaproteobacteria bacterium]
MTIVTRFPPSPTGFMHIGTARTALFNWLYARRHSGKMLFRIEDTDRARHNEEAVVALINAMKWLEMDWDGEIVSQFSMRERHAEVARELLAAGKAYYCYCTPEELEEMREKARAEGKPTFYDRRWRDSTATPPVGIDPVIRIKSPLDGASTVPDHVQGDVTVNNEQLDDFIILRSDGTPTYMLSVVVDDHDMGVTHVIRGDDHLNNTFRQNVIYDAMGWVKPEYAHLPLILGPDGAKMSKRHGAASVEEYREMGYLPEAMRNYLLRLGWSHGDDEIISTAQAKEWFDLEHIGKSPARFDFDKLESLNAHYIKECDADRLMALALPFYQSRHNVEPDQESQKRIMCALDELKSRAKTLLQFVDESVFFIRAPQDYDEKAIAQFTPDSLAMLSTLMDKLPGMSSFDAESYKALCLEIADGKLGKIGMPLRAAVTGTTQSPSIFDACITLGLEETSARIREAIERFAAQAA